MFAALLQGERGPEVLADLARGNLRKKLSQLRQALAGHIQPHHLVLIGQIVAHIYFLGQAIDEVQREIELRLAPFEQTLQLLQTIPGIKAVCECRHSGRNRREHGPVSQRPRILRRGSVCARRTKRALASTCRAR